MVSLYEQIILLFFNHTIKRSLYSDGELFKIYLKSLNNQGDYHGKVILANVNIYIRVSAQCVHQ